MRPEVGLVLGARYELVERIAVGGMGEVWQARDRGAGRLVAAKVLRAELAGDERFLSRLRAEARNSAGLRHPNLAALLDHGEQENSGYLIMELVRGEPMSELLQRERVLDPGVLLPILAQTARGLHAVHTAGVVHRDVKPSNILLIPDGRVKLTDFGISLGTDQAPMTAAGMVMGTAQYLPPEQAMGRAAQPAGDVYALGIIAYEALVGSRPYTGATQVDIAFAHVNEPLPPLPAHVPQELRAVVEQMLAKDPQERPVSAAAVGRSLERIAEDLGDRRWVTTAGPAAHRADPPLVASPASPRVSSPRSAPSAPPLTHSNTAPLLAVEPVPSLPPTPPPRPADAPVSRRSLAAHRAPSLTVQPATVGQRTAAGQHAAAQEPHGDAETAVGPAGPRWRFPRWPQMAADRLWLGMVVSATLVAVVLVLLTIGSLALAESAAGQPPGAAHTPTTAKDG